MHQPELQELLLTEKNQVVNVKNLSHVDYTAKYGELVSFSLNKHMPIHRWFPFIEGYSSEFVRRILGEQKKLPNLCLDPFGGIGTTALTCQELGIECYSVEINPFMYEASRVKLRADYSSYTFENLINEFGSYLNSSTEANVPPALESNTFFEDANKDRWIFNKETTNGIVDILNYISLLELQEDKYASLFRLALGSILMDVSNVFRNGKCLSYKKNWQSKKISRSEVHERFLRVCKEVILIDLRSRERVQPIVHNYIYAVNGDSRNCLDNIASDSVDIVITSPPYLNSRDYTDIYRLELWVLGYLKSFEKERALRRAALTSHVQVPIPEMNFPKIDSLLEFIKLLQSKGPLWNPNILNMIKGYFADMEIVFTHLYRTLRENGMVYLNVSNSAYSESVCEVDNILGEIAQNVGFHMVEIRTARFVKSSSQQSLSRKLRESVLVLKKA